MLKKIGKRIGLGILISSMLFGNTVYAADDKEEKITIHLMDYFGGTDTDVSGRFLQEILENEFEEAFPNVELIRDSYDNVTYKRKIKVLMAADETPDIMMSYGAGFSEAFAESGKVLAIDEYLDDFTKEHMDMNLQENYTYDGVRYGLCYSSWVGVLYCNKALFAQIGAEIPKTYEELVQVCKDFREAGIEPIALGMMNQWQGQQFVNEFSIQLGGADYYKQMGNGEISLDNEVLAQAAQLTADLVNEGAFYSRMNQTLSSEAEEMFLDGKAAMIYIGNWYTSDAEEALGDDLAVAKMPAVPGALETNDYYGGAVNGWLVSSKTEYPEIAVDIIEWLSYRMSCYQPENATFFIDEGDEMNEVSETAQEILDLYENKESGGIAWDTLMKSDRTTVWLDACSQLFEGRINGKEFAELLEQQIG